MTGQMATAALPLALFLQSAKKSVVDLWSSVTHTLGPTLRRLGIWFRFRGWDFRDFLTDGKAFKPWHNFETPMIFPKNNSGIRLAGLWILYFLGVMPRKAIEWWSHLNCTDFISRISSNYPWVNGGWRAARSASMPRNRRVLSFAELAWNASG